MAMIRDMAKFQSESAQVDRCFTTYLTDLHVDYDTESREDDPVIYDIAVSNIIELRQQNEGSITLRDIENPLLFRKLLDHIKEDSCLHMCLTYYNISIQRKGKKSRRDILALVTNNKPNRCCMDERKIGKLFSGKTYTLTKTGMDRFTVDPELFRQ